jgi:hypothetical protein
VNLIRFLAAPAAVLAVAAGTGCGPAKPTAAAASHSPSATAVAPPDVTALTQVASLAEHAASVHVTVTRVPGIKDPQTDLSLTRDGGAYGTLAGTSYSAQILVRGSVGYNRVTPGWLHGMGLPASGCPRMCGKYVGIAEGAALIQLQMSPASTVIGSERSPRRPFRGSCLPCC